MPNAATLEPTGSSPRLLNLLLAPLRVPGHVIASIETIAAAVVSLERDAHDRLGSIDDRAEALLAALADLQGPVDRIEGHVTDLERLEEAVTVGMDEIKVDINTRMIAVESEVHALRPAIEQMARNLETVVQLLPHPNDGPLARLRDTLTAN
jgi:hypothetical protein